MTRVPLALLLLAGYPAVAAIQVTSANLVRTPPPGILMPRTPVEAETDFLTTDPAVYYLLTWTGGSADDKLRLEWRNPAGAVVQQNQHAAVAGVAQNRLIWKLLIAGGPAASTPGTWQVRLFSNGQSVSTADFKISAPPVTAVNIGSRSLMPDATISVPYYLQLTAQGGKPPYKWTSIKALPNGLTLSDTGIVTGTPVRRGSYRAIVEARDSAGNSVVRTFGLGIGAPAASEVKAATRNLLKAAGPNACSQTVSQTGFTAADSDVVLAFTLEAPRGREGRVEFLDPRGEIFQMTHVAKAAERQECVVKTLPLAGHRAAQMPGEWRVRLFWADLEVFTLKFTVAAAGPGAVARAPVTARSGRIAVLISNQRYDKLPASKLVAPDLDALATTLRQDGFEVVRTSDATLENLRAIETTLEATLQPGDTALVYYAGYDARAGGDYWLLPVNFDPSVTGPMQSRAYSALRLLQWLEDSKAALKFVFLDGALPAGQTGENLGAVMGEVDESTALVYSRNPVPGAFARALAGVLGKPDIDARTALGVELTKAAGNPAPVPILGGGADFVFRAH